MMGLMMKVFPMFDDESFPDNDGFDGSTDALGKEV